MRATLSVLGLYTYYPKLFEDMSFPEALDKDAFVEQLLFETAELEVLYSNPEFFKAALLAWSKAQLPIWTKLYESTILEFNPLWNKDAYYEESEKETRDLSDTHTTRDTGTIKTDGKSSASKTTDFDGDTKTRVAGFNSESEALRDHVVEDDTTKETESSSGSSTDTLNTNRAEAGTDTGTIERVHTRREYGNIGVTTSTALLNEYRDFVKFNIYDKMIEDFKKRFCLLVY